MSYIKFTSRVKYHTHCYLILLLLGMLALRAITLSTLDLLDPTETRYAVISQNMINSGDWITPQFPLRGPDVPYLAKPPLHFWATALSFAVFGVNEWSARVPSFLGLVLICGTLIIFGMRFLSLEIGLNAAIIAASSVLLFFLSGANVVDVSLGAFLCLAMLSFSLWNECTDQNRRRHFAYLFFLSLALAFLTKGPVALVLSGIPLVAWLYVQRRLSLLREVPWISGISVFAVVICPWFFIAEVRNPGFMEYFIVNENFGRYLLKNYGDLYGTGHRYPRGTSLIMIFIGMLPFSLLLFTLRRFEWRKIVSPAWHKSEPWVSYALIWGIAPIFFFLLVRQLHFGYVIPAIPGLAIFFAVIAGRVVFESADFSRRINKLLVLAAWIILVCIAVAWIYATLRINLFPIVTIGVSLAVFAIVLLRKYFDRLGTTGTLGSLSVALCFCALLVSSNYLNGSKSTKEIINFIVSHGSEHCSDVALVSSKSYSAFFYSRIANESLRQNISFSFIELNELDNRNIPHHLLIEQKNFMKLERASSHEWQVLKTIGSWVYLEHTDAHTRSV